MVDITILVIENGFKKKSASDILVIEKKPSHL